MSQHKRRHRTYLPRSIHQSRPLDFGEKWTQETRIEFCFAQFYLNIFELEREVIGCAPFYVASEEIVCYQSDHRGLIMNLIRSIENLTEQIYKPQTPRVSTSSEQANMRPPSPSIPEREFLFKALEQSLRLDGRALLESRTPTLTFGPELGWVDCAMGKTRLVLILPKSQLHLHSRRQTYHYSISWKYLIDIFYYYYYYQCPRSCWR